MDRLQHSWTARWRPLIVHGQVQGGDDRDGGLSNAQRAWFIRFHLLFAVLAAFTAIAATADRSTALTNRLLALVILLLLVAWFYRRIWKDGDDRTFSCILYISVGLPLFFILINLHPAYRLLIFVAYWQIFALLRLWHSIIASAILTILLLVSFDEGPWRFPLSDPSAWIIFIEGPWRFPLSDPSAWIIFIASLVMGGGMAAFIGALINEGDKRRKLIDELESARERLAHSERQAGVLSERQRIAGEIHDTIAQDLTSVVMHLEAALGRFGPAPHPAIDHIEQGIGAARTGIAEARRIVYALLPQILESQGLTGALRLTVEKWRRSAGVGASFRLIGEEPSLPRQAEVVLLRAVQEALTNVRKHASARNVVVTMTNLSDDLALDIHDDGVGFDPDRLSTVDMNVTNGYGMGLGLETLGERIRSLGGVLTIESSPDSGCTVSISLPLPIGSSQMAELAAEAHAAPAGAGAELHDR